MGKHIHQLSLWIYQHFKTLWIPFTMGMLIPALYINWNPTQNRMYNDLKSVAIELSNKIDGFVEDLFQEIYALPVYGKKIVTCQSDLYPYLEHITLNNPKVSGILVSGNTHRLFCSTVPNTQGLLSTAIAVRTLLGPYQQRLFDQPVYLIQQRMGHYHIGILIVASIIANELKTKQEKTSSVALYSVFEKKNLFRMEHTEANKNWAFTKTLQKQTPENTIGLFAIEKLQNLQGVSVVVFENSKTVLHTLWYSQIISILIVLICSFILYVLLHNIMTRRYSLQGAIKLAIKNEEFYPVYQPLFHSEERRFSGAEVLLRWENEDRQIIMPDFFIVEAEATGLILPITLQIIEIALKESRALLRDHPYFHLAFNITALHFADPHFFTHFNQLIDKYKISPKQILLEITERELLDINNPIYIDTMHALQQKGFSFAVDDYGTGHASISYLHHLPFSYLKIDKLFVQAIGSKAITESLNDAIIQMAKGLNLIIIAEGVETQEQATYLANNGVRLLQGWYYSKPLPLDELSILLKGEHR